MLQKWQHLHCPDFIQQCLAELLSAWDADCCLILTPQFPHDGVSCMSTCRAVKDTSCCVCTASARPHSHAHIMVISSAHLPVTGSAWQTHMCSCICGGCKSGSTCSAQQQTSAVAVALQAPCQKFAEPFLSTWQGCYPCGCNAGLSTNHSCGVQCRWSWPSSRKCQQSHWGVQCGNPVCC